MTRALFTIVLLVQVSASGGRLTSAAWVAHSRPSADERACTNDSRLFWTVSLVDGAPTARRVERPRMRVEPLPFRYSSDPDRAGERYVVRIEGGWLVGFNNGEFGGALWWFSPDGKQSHRIRPTNPGAENVLGLPEVNGEHLVLMGLDHLDERSGRIFKAVQTTGDWTLQPIAVLDAEPRVWTVAGAKLVFTTKSGLWTTDGTDTHRLYQTDLGDFAPQSIVRASDGAFYLGLRYYALKLLEQDGRWVESWYVPADCQKVTLKDLACECAK